MNMNAITKLGQHLDEYEALGFVEIAGETKLGYDRLEDGKEHAEFFADDEPEQIVFKKEDYFTKIDENEHSKIEWIVPNAQKNGMEPLRVTLAPGGRSMELKPSEAEEFGYVLKGAIRIIRGTKSYLVKSGESFYLKGLKRHHIEAYGVKEAVFIWVSTPPNF